MNKILLIADIFVNDRCIVLNLSLEFIPFISCWSDIIEIIIITLIWTFFGCSNIYLTKMSALFFVFYSV
jgi:hypothetical protein